MAYAKSRRFALFFAIATLAAAPCRGGIYNVTINPREDDAYGRARYRLWIPPDVETVRGLIVRQHGCGPESRKFGLEYANDLQWQALASKWDCGLIGTELSGPKDDCTAWIIPSDGSAAALHVALERFADQTRHPEIRHVPWCLWGHSGGAIWTTNMTYFMPDRVVATFSRSGGLSRSDVTYLRSQPASADDEPRAFDVPIMFSYGERENVESSEHYELIRGIHSVYTVGRAHQAVWSLAVHPECGHENGNSRHLAIPFFDACLAQRLPPTQAVETAVEAAGRTGTAVIPLNPMNRENGWYADPDTKTAHRVVGFQNDTGSVGWLPDETTVRTWQEFSKTGSVVDRSPPPPPTAVRVAGQPGRVTVTWVAFGDLQSGIKEFRLYRDGQAVGKVNGPVVSPWNPNGHFHFWNESDQPPALTVRPAMRFIDRSPQGSTDCEYQVTTVNQAGLESSKAVGIANLGVIDK